MNLNILNVPVYYINLDEDVEQRESIELMLSDLGFTNVNRISGVMHRNKKVGVAHAHKKAMLAGLDGGSPFIVLEGDVTVKSFKQNLIIPDNADAYYLGISQWGLGGGRGIRRISAEKVDHTTFRLYNMLAAHAILYLNTEYVKFLLKSVDFFIQIETNQDKGRAESMKFWNIYAERDPLFMQTGRYLRHTNFSLPGRFCVPANGVFLLHNSI